MFSAVKLLYGALVELDAFSRAIDKITRQLFLALFGGGNNNLIGSAGHV